MIPLHPHDPPHIGPFRLLGRLGEDTCTRSYLATSAEHPAVDLRVVRSNLASSPAFRSAFAHRVETAYDVRSNHAPALLDHDLEHAAPWAALQYPAGPTLASTVRAHGPLPASALHPLALATAQALADLHTGHRTHASLSPEGVVLPAHGAVLADPGFEWALTQIQEEPPHPDFAAPEDGAAPATDIHAWAATLCWAAGTTAHERDPDRLPLQLRDLIEACLQEDPAMRPAAADLVQMLGGPAMPTPWAPDLAATLARAQEPANRALQAGQHRPKKDRTAPIALTAGGLTLALIAGLGAVWLTRDDGLDAATDEFPSLITDAGCLDQDTQLASPPATVEDLGAVQLDFSPDGDVIAVETEEIGLSLWDWQDGGEIARVFGDEKGSGGPNFAPVGCLLTAVSVHEFPGDREYNTLNTLDVPSGEITEHHGPQSERALDELERPRRSIGSDFSPSGDQLLVVLEPDHSLENRLAAVGVIDMDTGELTHTLGGELGDLVHDAQFVDEERIITEGDLVLEVRSVENDEVEQTIRNATGKFTLSHDRTEVFFLSEGDLVHWDLESESEVSRYSVQEYYEKTEPEDEYGQWGEISVSPEGDLLHFWWYELPPPEEQGDVIEDDEVEEHSYLWDLETGENITENEGDDYLVRNIAFHPEQEVIAAINDERGIDLLDPDTLDVIDTLP
ncbi:kinase [Nocardiopsis sp. HNM0947]|uniref:Kinase n=1 Tax=Nocardiopsis coralli TaxID=2772213 RepID=A0ABR9PAP3_9ACTN|nr:protein kinase family protein [Nocardiopsis coralli]MBE3000913.1 kinase [Nocardiopsis coralli]